MQVSDILKQLEAAKDQFPTEAVEEALNRPEEIAPELLRVLAQTVQEPAKYTGEDGSMLHLFAIFILAQLREKRAYPLICQIISTPEETPFEVLGEWIMESLGQVLASVYDGDPKPLENLFENENVNEFVRSAVMQAFLTLEHNRLMPREQLLAYLRDLFQGRLERTPSYAWFSLVDAVRTLQATELLPAAREAFTAELVDPTVDTLEFYENDFQNEDLEQLRENHYLITDAIGEMSAWVRFNPEPPQDDVFDRPLVPITPLPSFAHPDYAAPAPYIRDEKIGRNEPCPCGSGKKYKKCCGK